MSVKSSVALNEVYLATINNVITTIYKALIEDDDNTVYNSMLFLYAYMTPELQSRMRRPDETISALLEDDNYNFRSLGLHDSETLDDVTDPADKEQLESMRYHIVLRDAALYLISAIITNLDKAGLVMNASVYTTLTPGSTIVSDEGKPEAKAYPEIVQDVIGKKKEKEEEEDDEENSEQQESI